MFAWNEAHMLFVFGYKVSAVTPKPFDVISIGVIPNMETVTGLRYKVHKIQSSC